MIKTVEIMKASREGVLTLVGELSLDQVNFIPKGFNNNIVWNIAHLVVTQQILCYKLSGLSLHISQALEAEFKKGTTPSAPINKARFDQIKTQFIDLSKQLEKDLESEIFTQFNSYTTSAGVVLNSIDDALLYNNYHEGLHRGTITALLKLI